MKKTFGFILALILAGNLVYLFVFTNAQITDNRFSYPLVFLSAFTLLFLYKPSKKVE